MKALSIFLALFSQGGDQAECQSPLEYDMPAIIREYRTLGAQVLRLKAKGIRNYQSRVMKENLNYLGDIIRERIASTESPDMRIHMEDAINDYFFAELE